MASLYPLVEYARKIGKNTADLTSSDMVKFTRWWMMYPKKDVVIAEIQAQQVKAQQVHTIIQGHKTMAKNTKFRDARTSRLTSEQVADVEEVENGVAYDMSEEGQGEIVCTMELTKMDVAALVFSIDQTMADFEMEGNKYGESLQGILEGLKGV